MNIHSTAQMMTAAAAALEARDVETLEAIERHCRGWIQSDHEAEAQLTLINSMIGAAYDLLDLES